MAQLVAEALLSSFVGMIFDKLASINFTDYFRGGKLDKLVEELESTLDSINQVLDDAEIKQYQDLNVKKWLGDVKHAMYEADQLLDEISSDTSLKKLKLESQPSSSNNFFGHFSANPFESRIKELLKNLKDLVKQKDVLQLKNGTWSRNQVGVVSSKPVERLETSYLVVDESEIYGRDDEKNEMVKFLFSDNGNGSGNQTPVSSIVGLGGMGKTTFAKVVYNDSRIQGHFELKAWVYVSESFDVVGLTKAILKSFHCPADDESILNLLQERLQHMLNGKKYLLVLDDIWNGNADYWEQLLLPFNHGSYGSKIIVTTRDKEVANVLKSTKLFDLKKLDKSDCWSLFVKHAFRGKNVCENPNLESIGKIIVEKCGGLPLAVKTLGQLLWKKFSQHDWMKILETDMWCLSDGENNVNPVLRLSYHNLPSNLKRCFAFCSIFTKGSYFHKDELIKLWMAEGLLKCRGQEKSEEELGNEILCDLESISFFQQSTVNNNYFDMHDLVNDLAKSVSGEFCMGMDGAKVEGIPERTRHIRLIFRSNFVEKLLEPICELKGLRSLLLEDYQSMLISNNVQRDMFSRLKYLRMLSFNSCKLSEVVDEIGNLNFLRYIDLSFTEISSLPDTICKLCNLQTLLLGECENLTKLPSNFSKLINLRYLELPYSIEKMPMHIGSLRDLQTLSCFTVEEKNGSDLKELEKLNHLRGRIHIQGLGKVIDPTDVTTRILKDKKYLEEIHMTFDGEREDMDGSSVESDVTSDGEREDIDGSIVESNVSVLEALQPNSNLKMLLISEYAGNSFPNWLRGSHLPNLVSLTLDCCELCSHLPPLGQIPSLKNLDISGCHGIKIIGKEFCSKSLEFLNFWRLKNCEEWCIEGFPRLKKLSIEDCPKLKRALPQHIPSLQKLVIRDCQMLDVSILNCVNIIELDIWNCNQILINELSSSLKRFAIGGNKYVEFPMDHLINNPNLEELVLDFKDFVECPSLDLRCYNSLRRLSISGWKSSSLPFSLHLFTSLDYLELSDCRELESFPIGLLHLKSLKRIFIVNCPSLELLPEEWGLHNSLLRLDIRGCPLLKEKYKEEGGERWHTISHIPTVWIM